MAISPNQTFVYRFDVQRQPCPSANETRWAGQGSGQASFLDAAGMVGPRPRFGLCAGWLTLFPTEGWTQSLPLRWFSDAEPPSQDSAARIAAIKASGAVWLEAQKEAHAEAASRSVRGDFASWTKAKNEAMANALRRRGQTRDLVSYALFVGEALAHVLQPGDELRFSRDGNGDFRYSVARNSETVFSAGSVGRVDDGGPMAVWQEYDNQPNPNADALRKKHPDMRVAERIDIRRPFVSVRIGDQMFYLDDGQEADVDPYYVFLARSNKKVPEMAFEFAPRAVHSAGRLATPGKELIVDAARQLTAPVTRTLQ